MDDVCTLIKETTGGRDKAGNPVTTTTEREVFCQVYGVARTEFYSAATAGLHPEITFRLQDFVEYEGEKLIRYDGELYAVIRTYRDRGSYHGTGGMDPNAIELICERRVGL